MRSELLALTSAASTGYVKSTRAQSCTCEESLCKCDPHGNFMSYLCHLATMLDKSQDTGFANFDHWYYDHERMKTLMDAYDRCINQHRRQMPAVLTLLRVSGKLAVLSEEVHAFREREKNFVAGLHFGPEGLKKHYQELQRTLLVMCERLNEGVGYGGGPIAPPGPELINKMMGGRRPGTMASQTSERDDDIDPCNVYTSGRVRNWTPL